MNYKYYCSSCSNSMLPKDSARGNNFSRPSSSLPPRKGRVIRKASRRRWPSVGLEGLSLHMAAGGGEGSWL